MGIQEILEIVGAIFTLIGAIFLLLGSIGLIRMPDVYTRIQAGTKASTMGAMMSLFGIGLIHLNWIGKIILIIISILITNPVSSHLLARAAHFIGVPLTRKSVMDKLKEDETGSIEQINTEESMKKPETI